MSYASEQQNGTYLSEDFLLDQFFGSTDELYPVKIIESRYAYVEPKKNLRVPLLRHASWDQGLLFSNILKEFNRRSYTPKAILTKNEVVCDVW